MWYGGNSDETFLAMDLVQPQVRFPLEFCCLVHLNAPYFLRSLNEEQWHQHCVYR